MRIIFIRHGHPNYREDCLTELGHMQAEAARERLEREKIDKFFSSSCGRAAQTAEHVAEGRGMEVELLDFMREISWGSIDGDELTHNGHPWRTVDDMVASGQDLFSSTWRKEEPFLRNKVVRYADTVAENFDHFLADLGYVREGDYYRVIAPKYDTVLLASHGGSSSAVLSHIFNLPLPFVLRSICPEFTAITIVTFSDEVGKLISPRFELMNDAEHIRGISGESMYGK